MNKLCKATLALAAPIFLGLTAVAGADEPPSAGQQFLAPMVGQEGATHRAGAIQLAKAEFLESSMNSQDSAVRRQLGAFVKKYKSSDIGYPATAKVTDIHDYQVINKKGDIYEVNIRYQVVASVDTATFEDVFIIELAPDGSIDILEMQ